MASLLNLWYSRNLTLHSRIVNQKAQALSKLIYNTAVLPVTSSFIKKKLKKISPNLYGARKHHTTMIGPRAKGGLSKQCSQSNLDQKTR